MIHDIVVGAGGRIKQGSPLSAIAPAGEHKCMLNISGKPMVQWVLDGVAESREINRVFLVGLSPEQGLTCGDKPVLYIEPQSGVLNAVLAGARAIKRNRPLHDWGLWVAGDAPLVRGEMLDWFAREVRKTSYDFYFPTIKPEIMKRRFPKANRTRFRLRDRSFYVGDVCAGNTQLSDQQVHPLFGELGKSRSSPFRMARTIGLRFLLRFAFGRVSTTDCLRFGRERLGVNATIIDCPWAEMGMDVDKPEHLRIVEGELGRGNHKIV